MLQLQLFCAPEDGLIVTPESCRAVVRLNKFCDLCILLELCTRILLRYTDPWTLKIWQIIYSILGMACISHPLLAPRVSVRIAIPLPPPPYFRLATVWESLKFFLSSEGGARYTPCQIHFTPRGKPGTHSTGGYVRLGVGLDGSGKLRPHNSSSPGLSIA
jgi:hypothetical protein